MPKILGFGAVLALALVVAQQVQEKHIATSAIHIILPPVEPLHQYLKDHPHGIEPDAPTR
jgi:hypothetical protein